MLKVPSNVSLMPLPPRRGTQRPGNIWGRYPVRCDHIRVPFVTDACANCDRRHEAWVTHAHGNGWQQSVREALVSWLQSQRVDAALGFLRGIEFRTEWC